MLYIYNFLMKTSVLDQYSQYSYNCHCSYCSYLTVRILQFRSSGDIRQSLSRKSGFGDGNLTFRLKPWSWIETLGMI